MGLSLSRCLAGLALGLGLAAVPTLWPLPAPMVRPHADGTLAALLPGHSWSYRDTRLSWAPLAGDYVISLADLHVYGPRGRELLGSRRAELRHPLPLPGNAGRRPELVLETPGTIAMGELVRVARRQLMEPAPEDARAGPFAFLRALEPGWRGGTPAAAAPGRVPATGPARSAARVETLTLRPRAAGLEVALEGRLDGAAGNGAFAADGRWDPLSGDLDLEIDVARLRPAILDRLGALEAPVTGRIRLHLDPGIGLSRLAFDVTARSGTLELAELTGENVVLDGLRLTGTWREMGGRTEIRLDAIRLETGGAVFEGIASVDLGPAATVVTVSLEGPLGRAAALAPRWLGRLVHAVGPDPGTGRLALKARLDRPAGTWSGGGRLVAADGTPRQRAQDLVVTGEGRMPLILPRY
jgi:hypothetical protein